MRQTVLGLLVSALAASCAPPPAELPSVRVVTVLDGDSMRVLRDGREAEVRLHGVDAPEGGQPFGDESRRFLQGRLRGKTVTVDVRDVDQYGRFVARLNLDGTDIGLEIIRSGHGWHYARYSSDRAYAAAEREARSARRGLWQDASPQPPWEFRQEQGTRDRPAAPGESRGDAGARQTPTGPFHGNVGSHVFHAPGCDDYSCSACSAVFGTAGEATAAGYRPHRECVER